MIPNRPSPHPPITLPITLLRAFENKAFEMHAADYQAAATTVANTLRAEDLDVLIVLARSAPGVLPDMAENILFERAGCLTRGDRDPRLNALSLCTGLLDRLKSRVTPPI